MLQNLPKLTKDEFLLANLTASCASVTGKQAEWVSAAQQTFSKAFGKSCRLEFQRVSIEAKPEITGSIFAATWPPQAGLFWVEFETRRLQAAAYQMIEQPLPQTLDPKLSDLERGVVLYLLAQVFAATNDSFQISNRADLPVGPTVCLSLAFQIDKQDSFVRIWASRELVESIAKLMGPSPEALAKHAEERTSWASLPLCVVLAKVDLTQEDFAGLQAGDIVLFDNTVPVELQDKIAVGEVDALVGEPASKTLKGQLGLSDSGQYTFSISEIS